MKNKTIVVPMVNVQLLRKQRDWLTEEMSLHSEISHLGENSQHGDGILNLLDAMLDIAEDWQNDCD